MYVRENQKDSEGNLGLFDFHLLSSATIPLKIRTKENTKIAKIPIMLVNGSRLSKKVPVNGTFNNAKPAKILANIKRINRSIQLRLLSLHYMNESKKS